MSPEPDDRLIEVALDITDAGEVDWTRVRAEFPAEPGTVEALETLALLTAVHEPGGDEAFGAVTEPAEDGAPPTPDSGTAGRRWGPLELRRRIGAGSFGEVFVAFDPRLEREVALKLHRREAAEPSQRWLEEARRLARVRHPNVVAIYGADVHDGRAGMWMELVHGRTLEERLRREGPLGGREAVLVGIELCGALAAVHAAGLAHGDVKTSNVVREGVPGAAQGAGRIVLMDFGSAHDSAGGGGEPGTPLFSAPEVLAGRRASVASDLWSLGVVLYRLVSGKWPVEARNLRELQSRHAGEGHVPLRSVRPDLSDAFIATVERALHRDPGQRWEHAAAFQRALAAALGVESAASAESVRHRARTRRVVARALAVVAALVVSGAIVWLVSARGASWWRAWRTGPPQFVAETLAERAGEGANASLGAPVVWLGDIDGDGHGDVMAGAAGAGEGGAAYLYTPSISGLAPRLVFRGHDEEQLGQSIARAGDLNGDGHPDVAIGAWMHDGPGGRDAGRVYVHFGGPGLDTVPDLVLEGTHPAQYFGYSLGIGDVNGDGQADLLTGAPGHRQGSWVTGGAFVYFGGRALDARPDLELGPGVEGSSFGVGIGYAGDFNHDGAGDFVVSAHAHPAGGVSRGQAFVYFGGATLDDRPDLVLRGRRDGGWFGVVRTSAGDVTGDGIPDLLVAGERSDGLVPGAGAVWVYAGGSAPDDVPDWVLKGERRSDGFGSWATGVDDLDGDGAADVLVGAPWYDAAGAENAGRVYLFLGGRRFDDVPDHVITASRAKAYMMHATVVPDLRGDGVGGIVVGKRQESRDFSNCGVVEYLDLARWRLQLPGPGSAWPPGRPASLRWDGAVPVAISLSQDRGRTWQRIAARAGGRAHNVVSVMVPPTARDSVRIRFVSALRHAPGTLERNIGIAPR